MFSGKSVSFSELENNPFLEIDFVIAKPRMSLYMAYSTHIYDIYLKYFSPDDIHIYSVDEVFIDVTNYLEFYKMSAHDLTMKIIRHVLAETGITATAGIGTNLYLAKIAMDIVAKKMPADEDGARIAELDEMSYRRRLWEHRPLTDFWRIGRGYAEKLARNRIFTMGDIAEKSLYDEEFFYKLFGVNAELLIDHAWGFEPVTIADIKAYKPQSSSLSSGQVLQEPYTYEKALVIVREMADNLALDLTAKNLVTGKITLTIGYDAESFKNPKIAVEYRGAATTDLYGRRTPRHAHGTENLEKKTFSAKKITNAAINLFQRITDKKLLIRRITICACDVEIKEIYLENKVEQLDLFTNYSALEREIQAEGREENMQLAVLKIKEKYGKNAVLKGTNFEDGATMRERNEQIGGHKA